MLRETRGALKVLVEEGTGLILGAHLFCPESPEMINLVKRAMDSKIPASELAEQIYTHPTMTEAFKRLVRINKCSLFPCRGTVLPLY